MAHYSPMPDHPSHRMRTFTVGAQFDIVPPYEWIYMADHDTLHVHSLHI